jgi:hypothetical protein
MPDMDREPAICSSSPEEEKQVPHKMSQKDRAVQRPVPGSHSRLPPRQAAMMQIGVRFILELCSPSNFFLDKNNKPKRPPEVPYFSLIIIQLGGCFHTAARGAKFICATERNLLHPIEDWRSAAGHHGRPFKNRLFCAVG